MRCLETDYILTGVGEKYKGRNPQKSRVKYLTTVPRLGGREDCTERQVLKGCIYNKSKMGRRFVESELTR